MTALNQKPSHELSGAERKGLGFMVRHLSLTDHPLCAEASLARGQIWNHLVCIQRHLIQYQLAGSGV